MSTLLEKGHRQSQSGSHRELTGDALVPSAGINGCPSLGRAGMPGGCVRLSLVLTVQQWSEERADTQTLGSGELCMQQPQPQQPKLQPGLCAGAVGVRSSQQEVRVGEKSQVAVLWREGAAAARRILEQRKALPLATSLRHLSVLLSDTHAGRTSPAPSTVTQGFPHTPEA